MVFVINKLSTVLVSCFEGHQVAAVEEEAVKRDDNQCALGSH